MSNGKKAASLAVKLIVVAAAVVGTALSYIAGREAFMGGGKIFMYFTIQSNIFAAAVCAAGAVLLLRRSRVGGSLYVVKLVATVAITLTGVVFCFVLAPTLADKAWNVQNVLTHVAVPVLSVLDFFLVCPNVKLAKKDVFFVMIPPLCYAIFAGIGYAANWDFNTGHNYPYFFLNWGDPVGPLGFSAGFPFMGTVWWILALLAFLIAVAFVYILISNMIWKKAGGERR